MYRASSGAPLEHLLDAGDVVVGLSATGRWPAGLTHLGRSVRIEACDLTDVAEADAGRSHRSQAARGDLSPRRAGEPAGERRRPRGTWALNLGGALNLLEAVKASGLKPRVVLVGSGVCYGNPAPSTCPSVRTARYGRTIPTPRARRRPTFWASSITWPRDRRRDGPPVQPRRPSAVVQLRLGGLARQVAEVEAG